MARNRSLIRRRRKEREEKKCLNCEETLEGRYCHNCGQENIEQREPIGRILLYLIEGLTFFNSKFFKTLKPFLFKPGHLTKEYNSGKRVTFFSPIKMYFFFSFLYFLFFFWVGWQGDTANINLVSSKQSDSTQRNIVQEGDYEVAPPVYDNWFSRKVTKIREHAIKEGNNSVLQKLDQRYSNNIPKVIFLIMPFMALFLKLFFQKRYFIEHLIYSLHLHSFGFFVFLLLLMLSHILPNDGEPIAYIGALLLVLYILKSMRVVYAQSWKRIIGKTLIIGFLYSFTFGIGFLVNILIAIALF